jgi:hypothetical protein
MVNGQTSSSPSLLLPASFTMGHLMRHALPRYAKIVFLLAGIAASCAGPLAAAEPALDLSRAVINTPPDLSGPEKKAVAMLVEEVEKRTQLHWQSGDVARLSPAEVVPAIYIGQDAGLRRFAKHLGPEFSASNTKPKAEGYQIQAGVVAGAPVVRVAGSDARGVLFGVGRLLRSMTMEKQKVTLPAGFKATSAPHYPLRGHQLGYRPKTNSYDGWDLPQWEQYIRDLAVFGSNAIELIPPRSDDDSVSPHFPRPQIDMMAGMSKICDDYGLDVWIWYPAMDEDYSNPKMVEFALKEWGDVFKRLPRVDAVFVPGGDPGHTEPKYLMALLEKEAEVLQVTHPDAKMWVSPQSFSREWMDEFLAIMKTEPAWLAGVVHGPQTRMPLAELRAAIPRKYPIRNYPDITHSRSCQFPVPDWDTAFALTEGREVINPRPRAEAHIFRLTQPHTIGYIAYSEGCNDDVNKFVWSSLGWDPDADVPECLREYSRYFISPAFADDFAQGLLALEKNWEGPVLTNANINTTLQQFQAMEKAATPQDLLNWRFQQALYRAYFDAHVRSRLLYETRLEDEAMGELRRARRVGSLLAMAEADKVLDRAVTRPVSEDLRARVFELGEALFQSIHMQLSVGRYKAISVDRGANLDTLDKPLNSRAWLRERFESIRGIDSENGRLKQIEEIVNWTDPGPGGFYDDLGNASCQPHLVRGPGFAEDPDFFRSALTHFENVPQGRKSWWDQAIALFDAPLKLHYTGLEPGARYKVRVVYGGGLIRLLANDETEVHPLLRKPYERLEFDLPAGAAARGSLTLTWYGQPGRGGNGRGCQVAEVWLIKQ